MITPTSISEAFRLHYGYFPAFISRAPGRVNLIGEHTDYNDGFVLPLALPHSTWIAFSPRTDAVVHLHSLDFNQTESFSLLNVTKSLGWIEYVKGVAWALQQQGYVLKGFDGIVQSDVPIGAGLSSSAAIELASLNAFLTTSQLSLAPVQQAQLSQAAERDWVGTNCGIMDQMISAMGQKGRALFLDCRSLDFRYVALPNNAVIVVMDTGTRRALKDSRYNERRAECELAAKHLGKTSLRDVSLADLTHAQLPDTLQRRARHVVSENHRVLQVATGLLDAVQIGTLLNESHQSLRDDFEVSSQALDSIVGIAQLSNGCFGARMTGAGFAGCAIALVEKGFEKKFIETVGARYSQATSLVPSFFLAEASHGAEVLAV
jgi:galactokinase